MTAMPYREAVSLAFLWLFTFSPLRFAVVCQSSFNPSGRALKRSDLDIYFDLNSKSL
jgi:hypothetical protein